MPKRTILPRFDEMSRDAAQAPEEPTKSLLLRLEFEFCDDRPPVSDNKRPSARTLDLKVETAEIRTRSAIAFRALRTLSLGAGATETLKALSAVKSPRARCDHLCHQLSLRNLQRPVDTLPEPIEREAFPSLMEYVEAVEVASVSLRVAAKRRNEL